MFEFSCSTRVGLQTSPRLFLQSWVHPGPSSLLLGGGGGASGDASLTSAGTAEVKLLDLVTLDPGFEGYKDALTSGGHLQPGQVGIVCVALTKNLGVFARSYSASG